MFLSRIQLFRRLQRTADGPSELRYELPSTAVAGRVSPLPARSAEPRPGHGAARLGSSPDISRLLCCNGASARACGVALARPPQRTASTPASPEASCALHPRASTTFRDEQA